ncbi:hypothetical protein GUJ93_ZPchr0009g784 [Zizania palustris]|uniref:Uncharacterized protein n=1 Tax=Zizania palustris TaxID=103762 RepID=A0A8J5UYL1_ZIZPA|nr:hypothetical protein GUJ93_ZPchr0009g784 [Zizania palustris]
MRLAAGLFHPSDQILNAPDCAETSRRGGLVAVSVAVDAAMARQQVTAAAALAATLAAAAAVAAILSSLLYRRKCGGLATRVRELEASLAAATEKAAAERRGRVRAQQSLRRALSEQGAQLG